MKGFALYFSLFFSLFFTSVTLASTFVESEVSTLYFNHKKLTLDSPILIKNGISYVPIRELLPAMNATMQYRRKTNSYEIRFENSQHTIRLLLNASTFYHNGKKKTLPVKTFFALGRIYVPVYSFFQAIDIRMLPKKENLFHLSSKSPPQKPASKQKKSRQTKTPNTAKKNHHPSLKKPSRSPKKIALPTLPRFKADESLQISFQDKQSSLKNKFLYQHQKLYIDLYDFLQKLGYTQHRSGRIITLKKGSKKIHFNKEKKDFLIIKGRRYYPLLKTLEKLDFSYTYSAMENKIILLNKIKSIQIISRNYPPKIRINTAHPKPKVRSRSLFLNNGYYFDILHSIPDFDETSIETHSLDSIYKITCKKRNGASTRIRFFSENPMASPKITAVAGGFDITFNSHLSELKTIKDGKQLVIKALGKGPFSITSTIQKTPPLLIIDVKNCKSFLPPFIPSIGLFKEIKTSQYKRSPDITRLVFKFKETVPHFSIVKHIDHFKILFSPKPVQTAVKKKVKKAAVRPSLAKKPVAPKTVYKKRHPLKNKIILIDPGHGGKDPGAVVQKKHYEKYYNLDIAKRLKKLLTQKGALVVLTRSTDQSLSLSRRVYIANKNNADIFVSIHINSFIQAQARGTETYYYKYKDRRLAQHIQKQLAKDLGRKNNGTKRARLYILRHAKMPSALVEPLFMTNRSEFKLIQSPSFRQKIAQSTYQGILNYFKSL